jgi:hypothetical protein
MSVDVVQNGKPPLDETIPVSVAVLTDKNENETMPEPSAKPRSSPVKDLQDDLVAVRERLAAIEARLTSADQSTRDMIGEMAGLRKDVIQTFRSMFLAQVAIVIVAIGCISAIVGGTVVLRSDYGSVDIGNSSNGAVKAPVENK